MKTLRDTENKKLNTDKEKAGGLIRDHFVWNEGGRMLEEEEEEDVEEEVEENSLDEMTTKVEIAHSGTQNSSAPRPDGFSYRFIKTIKDTILRERLIEEVARNLIKGIILREWQDSKMVMIPKPGKDHEKTKGWRPINLINCISKLGQKVVADVLQGCGLLHKYQFGSVKGRSATEAALRTVTRAQRCLAKEGVVGWGFWDVKGGF